MLDRATSDDVLKATPATEAGEYEAPAVFEVGAAAENIHGPFMFIYDPDNETKIS
jgi:hypothetical protein